EHIGLNTQALCRELFAQRGREAQKSMWGIVGLHPRYPACIVEQAAAVALARQVHSYKAVRASAEQLLAQTIDRLDAMQPQLPLAMPTSPLTQEHELIRAPAEYAAFFNRHADDPQASAATAGETEPCA
ncbi:MAG: IS21 family transposase, partial [Burkholderiales bacterium]